MKPYVPLPFAEEDLPFAKNRREYRDFQRFDKAIKDAQSGDKDQLTKNINLAAQIASGLTSSAAVKHIVNRLCFISKDSGARKETAVYAADSIMRHLSVADEALLGKYEKHIGVHLRNMFKRALGQARTRLPLAAKFLTKVLPKWKEKGWFGLELDRIIDAVQKCAPSVPAPESLLRPPGRGGRRGEPVLPLAETMDDEFGDEVAAPAPGTPAQAPVPPPVMNPMGVATAKAGAPGTPAQPDYLIAPGTPRGFRIPATPMPGHLDVSPAILNLVPGTPKPPDVNNNIPGTPRLPGTPTIPGTPGAPAGAPAPFTPGLPAAPVPFTPGGAAPQTPGLPGAAPFTPRPQAAPAPFTPAGIAPGTPAAIVQPFTPRGPAPATPGVVMQPFTPKAPAAPGTPGPGVQPFTPKGPIAPGTPGIGSQPFTPRGPAPATPATGAQPFTPKAAGMAPATPGNMQPFTPRGPAPQTPGSMQPFTPAAPSAQPFTPGAQPFTPAVQPFTPGFAPGTPGLGGMGVPGTPGFIPFQGGEIAPVTPAPGAFKQGLGAPTTPGIAPGTPGVGVPGTPGFIPFRGGEVAPSTPAVRPLVAALQSSPLPTGALPLSQESAPGADGEVQPPAKRAAEAVVEESADAEGAKRQRLATPEGAQASGSLAEPQLPLLASQPEPATLDELAQESQPAAAVAENADSAAASFSEDDPLVRAAEAATAALAEGDLPPTGSEQGI